MLLPQRGAARLTKPESSSQAVDLVTHSPSSRARGTHTLPLSSLPRVGAGLPPAAGRSAPGKHAAMAPSGKGCSMRVAVPSAAQYPEVPRRQWWEAFVGTGGASQKRLLRDSGCTSMSLKSSAEARRPDANPPHASAAAPSRAGDARACQQRARRASAPAARATSPDQAAAQDAPSADKLLTSAVPPPPPPPERRLEDGAVAVCARVRAHGRRAGDGRGARQHDYRRSPFALPPRAGAAAAAAARGGAAARHCARGSIVRARARLGPTRRGAVGDAAARRHGRHVRGLPHLHGGGACGRALRAVRPLRLLRVLRGPAQARHLLHLRRRALPFLPHHDRALRRAAGREHRAAGAPAARCR